MALYLIPLATVLVAAIWAVAWIVVSRDRHRRDIAVTRLIVSVEPGKRKSMPVPAIELSPVGKPVTPPMKAVNLRALRPSRTKP